jgi:sporulation protein YlmC with PRC-barrel domain
MSDREEMDLALRMLDQQIVDWSGRRCGKVDDIAIDGDPGGKATVRGFFVGRRVTQARRPYLLRLVKGNFPRFGDRDEVEVSWSAISEITHLVKLEDDRETFGLGEGDRRLEPWLAKVPGG